MVMHQNGTRGSKGRTSWNLSMAASRVASTVRLMMARRAAWNRHTYTETTQSIHYMHIGQTSRGRTNKTIRKAASTDVLAAVVLALVQNSVTALTSNAHEEDRCHMHILQMFSTNPSNIRSQPLGVWSNSMILSTALSIC